MNISFTHCNVRYLKEICPLILLARVVKWLDDRGSGVQMSRPYLAVTT